MEKEKSITSSNKTSSIVENRVFALCWRLLLIMCSLGGIPCIMMIAVRPETNLYYFTMQTNFFVLFLFLYLTVKTIIQIVKKGTRGEVAHANPSLELFITYSITITFLGYVVLLSNMGFTMSGVGGAASDQVYAAGNWLVHIIVPFMAIIDFILFMPHGRVKYSSLVYWLIYPVLYLIMLLIRANVEHTQIFVIGTKVVEGNIQIIKSLYPYFFIAFENFEIWQSVLIVLALVVFFVLFGMLYIFIDKKLARFNKEAAK